MKNLLSIVFAVLCTGVVSAQSDALQGMHVPTEEDILSNTLSPESPYFYMPMFKRYMDGDLTLTDEHYFYLYYGYAYEADYDAHRELPGETVMREIFARTENPTREDALAIIEAGKLNMAVDPFSPSNINLMTYAYGLVGDTLNVRICSDRFARIVRAITSSGTGEREKTPWHILRFSHADDIIAARGLVIVNKQVRSRDVEYIQVGRNSASVRGYFFDFGRVYWRPYEGERVGRKSKWMFNGTPL